MKCRSRRSISIICVLLLVISVLSLSACGQDTASAAPNPSVENTPQYTPTEAKDAPPNIVGEYRWNNENGYMSTVFHSDMTFEGIRASNSDSILEFFEGGVYSVSDNLVTITWDAGVVEELTYDSAQRTLTDNTYGKVESFVTANVDGALSIVGTWIPLSDSAPFNFSFNDVIYSGSDSITFYNDGSYSINNSDKRYSGTYKTIHDGAAIQIDDEKSYTSPEVMRYTILSEKLMFIEASPDFFPGVYFVMERID